MHRSVNAQAGSHVFVWIPGVRTFQTHPFTLVSSSPAEFVASGQNGFTKELHQLALRDPKAKRRAAIEGPYGHVPAVADFDKVLLIAGGSGATFTFALAMDWMKRHASRKRLLDFVWTIKNTGEYWRLTVDNADTKTLQNIQAGSKPS